MSIRHDYKSAAMGQHRQRARRYGLLVMTLVLIGLFGGLLAYIRGDRPQPALAVASVTPTAPAHPPAAPAPQTTATSVAQPDPVKPKYDFYTELPKRQIDVRRETARPGQVSQPAPARMQPAANNLPRKPAAPRRNTTPATPTVATPSGAKPDSKTANSKTANSKTANSKTANSKTANSTPATVKTANAEPANSKSTSKNPKSTPMTSGPAVAKPRPAAPTAAAPARTAQPLRPLANNNSKIVVKTE